MFVLVTEWLSAPFKADREMKLLEKFDYIDPNNKIWSVPAGETIDGATIPKVFWNTVGSPFVGDYRLASVVHDYYCKVRTESDDDTHLMFYYACLAGGVSKINAKVLYEAVLIGGPDWKTINATIAPQGGFPFSVPQTETEIVIDINKLYNEEEALQALEWVKNNDPDLENIKQKAEQLVKKESSIPNRLIGK